MAKSIYEILNDMQTTTSVPGFGKEISHTIPRELLPTAEQFEDESSLIDWATEQDCLHACMQKGIQKFLIEIRAAFKSCKKDAVWSEDYGQENVDNLEWTITKRPNSIKSDRDTALDFLSGLASEQLQEFLEKAQK